MFRRKKTNDLARKNSATNKTAPVFSYYSNRSNSDFNSRIRNMPGSENTKKQKTVVWWFGYLPALVSIVLVVLASMYATTLETNPRIQISSIDGKPAVLQPISVYESAAHEILQRSVFNRSKFTINSDKLANAMQDRFPELGEIVVTVPLISRYPIIDVQPAVPVFVLNGKGGSFVIDTNGRAVLKANQLKSSVKDKLPLVTDNSGSDISLGKQLFPTDLVVFIGQIDTQLRTKKVGVVSYSLPALANELHVHITDVPYYIKCNTDTDARLQVGTYLAVSDKLRKDGITPAEYMDVRIEGRAYYK